jgi:hypothetical protein
MDRIEGSPGTSKAAASPQQNLTLLATQLRELLLQFEKSIHSLQANPALLQDQTHGAKIAQCVSQLNALSKQAAK